MGGWVAGAGGGFAAGFSSSLLNGGSIGDAFKAGVIGGVLGGLSAGIAHGIGSSSLGVEGKALAHGVSQGALAEAQGGEFRHGFYSGFFSKVAAGPVQETFGRATNQIAAAAVVGGTSSAVGGGKFANGAVSGAFVAMFGAGREKWKSDLSDKEANATFNYEPLGENRRGTGNLIQRVFKPHAHRGVHYNVKLSNGKRLTGWTTDTHDIEKILKGISLGGRIARFRFSAHHNGGGFWGAEAGPTMSDSSFVGLYTVDNVAANAKFFFSFCNGQLCQAAIGSNLSGLNVSIRYTEGMNSNIPDTIVYAPALLVEIFSDYSKGDFGKRSY